MKIAKAMDSNDQIEFFELLIVCSELLHQWGVGDDSKIQNWVQEISESLRRRDDRLRAEELKKAA